MNSLWLRFCPLAFAQWMQWINIYIYMYIKDCLSHTWDVLNEDMTMIHYLCLMDRSTYWLGVWTFPLWTTWPFFKDVPGSCWDVRPLHCSMNLKDRKNRWKQGRREWRGRGRDRSSRVTEGMWEQKQKETEQSCFNHFNDLAQENFTPMRNVLIPFLGTLPLIFHSSISQMLVVTQQKGLTPTQYWSLQSSANFTSPKYKDTEFSYSSND